MQTGVCVFISFFLKSMISSLALLMLSSRLFCKIVHFVPIRSSIVVCNLANDSGVVHKLHNRVLSVLGIAVVGVQREQGLSTQPWGALVFSTGRCDHWSDLSGVCLWGSPISSCRVWCNVECIVVLPSELSANYSTNLNKLTIRMLFTCHFWTTTSSLLHLLSYYSFF